MNQNEPTIKVSSDAITKKYGEISNMYKTGRSNQFNCLVTGNRGCGKTTFSITGRRPVLVHSFDPGGTESIRDEIEEGWVIADTRFEKEDPKKPAAFILWDKEMDELIKMDFFSSIGTYVIDSATTWGSAALYEILKRDGRPGGVPYENNWLPQMTLLENAMRRVMSLPCDVVFTAHPTTEKDEVSGRIFAYPYITGKLKIRIPLLFTESYTMVTKEKASGIEYWLLTRPSGIHTASSRFGRKGKFDLYEKPDIKSLMKKAGISAEDKEPLTNKEEEK